MRGDRSGELPAGGVDAGVGWWSTLLRVRVLRFLGVGASMAHTYRGGGRGGGGRTVVAVWPAAESRQS